MNSLYVAAEGATTSVPSSLFSNDVAHSFKFSARNEVQPPEPSRPTRWFHQSDCPSPSPSSCATSSLISTEPSPDPLAGSHAAVRLGDKVQSRYSRDLLDIFKPRTTSVSQSGDNRLSSGTPGDTQCRGFSGSSGGLTRTSPGGVATSGSPTSVSTTHSSGAQLKQVLSSTVIGDPSPVGADSQNSPAIGSPLHNHKPLLEGSYTTASPGVQSPQPRSLELPVSSAHPQQCQLQVKVESGQEKHQTQHVRFGRSIDTPRTTTASPHSLKAPYLAAPLPRVAEADRFVVDLLQDFTYEEVREVQEWIAAGGKASRAWMGLRYPPLVGATPPTVTDLVISEDISAAIAVLEAAPVLLEAESDLHFSQFFRASLMGRDVDDESITDERGDAVDTPHQEGVRVQGEAQVSAVGDRGVGAGLAHSKSAVLPLGVPHRETVPSPSFVALDDMYFSGVGVDADGEDDLSLSPIVGVSPSSRSPHYHHGDADDTGAAPLPGLASLMSPSPRLSNIDRRLVWPSSSLPPEKGTKAPRYRTLSPMSMSTSFSLQSFDVGRRIGQGYTSKTFLAREKRSQAVVALRVFDKSIVQRRDGGAHLLKQGTRLQMAAGRCCSHIVKLYASFTDARHCYTVLEFADGGDLASYLSRQRHQRLSEGSVRSIVYQLVLALRYLHKQRIVHRSVTARNVLLHRGEACPTAKLGDLAFAVELPDGHSRWLGKLESSHIAEESLDYAAPEVIQGHGWSCKSDMWALGVLVYTMLWGHHPFEHVSSSEMKRLICSGAVPYSAHSFSHTCMSFVRSLLCLHEAARSTAAAALEHPFLADGVHASTAAPVCTKRDKGDYCHAQSCESAFCAPSEKKAVVGESSFGARWEPVSRPLFKTLSLAAVRIGTDVDRNIEEGHLSASSARSMSTKTAIHCSSAVSHFHAPALDASVPQCWESTLFCSSTTVSSPSSITSLSTACAVCRSPKRQGDGTRRTTDRAAPAGAQSSGGYHAPFMPFELPTHLSQGTPRLSSAAPPTAHHSGTPSNEEVETWLGYRSNAAGSRSADPADRNSLTTLSDMSASFLSTTRTPHTPVLCLSPATTSIFTDSGAAAATPYPVFSGANTHNAHCLQSKPFHAHCRRSHEQDEPLAAGVIDDSLHGRKGGNSEDPRSSHLPGSTSTAYLPGDTRAHWACDGAEVTVSSSTASATSSFPARVETCRAGAPSRAMVLSPRQQLVGHSAFLTAAGDTSSSQRWLPPGLSGFH